MKWIYDITTTILIIKVQLSTYISADLDYVTMDNNTECCPEDIDFRKEIRVMNSTEVNTSVKFNSTLPPFSISKGNASIKRQKENEYNLTHQMFDNQRRRKKKLPLTIIIAGPAAAVGICLFLCIAFYFHNMQLNSQAKRLSITLNVTSHSNRSSICIETNSTCTQHLMKPSPTPSVRIPRDDMFTSSQKRKSTLSVPTLNVPPTLQHKRGSSWSAFADQEMLTLAAPRRHSTFIF